MNSLVTKFVMVWLHPWQTMRSLKEEGENTSIVPSMIFIVVMGLISGIITSIAGMFLPTAQIPGGSKAAVWLATGVVPLVSFIGSFVGAFIIWGLVDGILKSTMPQYKTAYRLLALLAVFSPVSALLSPIPKVGQVLAIIVNIYATVVMVGGIIIIRQTPFWRTIAICFVFFGLLFTLGIFARIAAQRQLQAGGPGFNDFGAGTGSDFDLPAGDDLSETSDELEQQLQGMADKAKANEKK